MMLRLALAAALAGASVVSAQSPVRADAVAPTPASLNWFHGEWEGDVDFIGSLAKGHLVVRPGLVGTATELTFTADVSATEKRPAFRFEGKGTYRVKPDGTVTGLWADSLGNFHELKGKTKDGALRVTWGDARSEVGHSSYVLGADGVLTVTDSAFVQGAVQVFGTGKYRKKG
jgi:hypothetical protein